MPMPHGGGANGKWGRMAPKEARMGGLEARMDEQQVAEAQEAQESEELHSEPDWKAEARKWEKFAKENKAAKEELDALKAERMSESEKLQARAEKAEAQLKELAAERERADAAAEVSKKTEVPLELLLFCKDRDSMEAFAEVYASHVHASQTHSAPQSRRTRIVRESETPTSNRDVFAEMAANLL